MASELGAPGLDKVGYLSALDVFRDLSREELAWLGSVTVQTSCDAGQVIYTPGQSGEVLYLLKRGSINLYRLSLEGHKLLIARLAEHTFFGEMSILGQGMYDTFAEAAEPCLLCAMSRADVERLVLAKPIVGLRILQILGERLLQAHVLLEDMAFRKVTSRVAALLLRLAEQQHSRSVVGYTHQDLADMAGTFRETVTEALNHLKAGQLIEIGRARIELLDFSGLQNAAGTPEAQSPPPKVRRSPISALKRALTGG